MIKINKILLSIIISIIFTFKSYGGENSLVVRNFNESNLNLNLSFHSRFNDDKIHPGIVLMVSGASFFTASLLTGKISNGTGYDYLPWYRQYARTSGLITGGLLFTGGIIYTISF